jgi:hypothetical protein
MKPPILFDDEQKQWMEWAEKANAKFKLGAHQRNIFYGLSVEYILGLIDGARRPSTRDDLITVRCALSGLPLSIKDNPSLDRISSEYGYCFGNIQLVFPRTNLMKSVYQNKEYIDMCKSVADNYPTPEEFQDIIKNSPR